MPQALLIGGDTPTCAMVRFLLEDDGCTVLEAATVDVVAHDPGELPDLLVLLPNEQEESSLHVLSRLHESGYRQPTVLLTRSTSTQLRQLAFSLGVRDIISLPTLAQELRDRLREALDQHAEPATNPRESNSLHAGGLTLNTATGVVSKGTEWYVQLTKREAALLQILMATPGHPVEHWRLEDQVWTDENASNALAVLIGRLRTKLPQQGYIHTIHGYGYVFESRSKPRRPADTDVQPQVLLVEDDQVTANMVIEVLQQAGYSVAHVSGRDAPTAARQGLPKLIILDINMPGMNGVEVRQQLRTSPRTADIPIIAFSAGDNLRAHVASMGADDYLSKPFNIDELLLRVEKWVGSCTYFEKAKL